MHPTPSIIAVAIGASLALLSAGCGRVIEEEEPPELIEHRVEPCRTWCSAQLDPECGAIIEDQEFRAVEDCVEDCASSLRWGWAQQEDGTDACAEEWFAMADCMGALSCEEQQSYFRRVSSDWDYPCKEEIMSKIDCWNSTPSIEKVQDGE